MALALPAAAAGRGRSRRSARRGGPETVVSARSARAVRAREEADAIAVAFSSASNRRRRRARRGLVPRPGAPRHVARPAGRWSMRPRNGASLRPAGARGREPARSGARRSRRSRRRRVRVSFRALLIRFEEGRGQRGDAVSFRRRVEAATRSGWSAVAQIAVPARRAPRGQGGPSTLDLLGALVPQTGRAIRRTAYRDPERLARPACPSQSDLEHLGTPGRGLERESIRGSDRDRVLRRSAAHPRILLRAGPLREERQKAPTG
jgi:hypothetical protein